MLSHLSKVTQPVSGGAEALTSGPHASPMAHSQRPRQESHKGETTAWGGAGTVLGWELSLLPFLPVGSLSPVPHPKQASLSPKGLMVCACVGNVRG